MGTRAKQTMELRRLEARLQAFEVLVNLTTSKVLGRIERVLAGFGQKHELGFALQDPKTTRVMSMGSLNAKWSVTGTKKDSLFLTTTEDKGHRDLGDGHSQSDVPYVAFEFTAPGIRVVYECFRFQTDEGMMDWLEQTWNTFTTNFKGII